jgi:hypothetical protein
MICGVEEELVFIDDSSGEHHFPINGKYIPISSVGERVAVKGN